MAASHIPPGMPETVPISSLVCEGPTAGAYFALMKPMAASIVGRMITSTIHVLILVRAFKKEPLH